MPLQTRCDNRLVYQRKPTTRRIGFSLSLTNVVEIKTNRSAVARQVKTCPTDYSPRTVMTGHRACRTTFSVRLPNRV
jgi:hypothetical protein